MITLSIEKRSPRANAPDGQIQESPKSRLKSSLWAIARKFGLLAGAAGLSMISIIVIVEGLFRQYGGRTLI
jgi:hypothetical protein